MNSLPGFGVRVRQGGSKRYIFQYKVNGTNRRVTFKGVNVKQARAAAQILAAKVTLGADPALEKESPTTLLATPSGAAWSDISPAHKAGGASARCKRSEGTLSEISFRCIGCTSRK